MLTTKQKKSEKITHKQPLVVTTYKDKIWFLYKIFHEGKSDLYLIASKDGVLLSKTRKKITILLPTGAEEDIDGCEKFHIAKQGDEYVMTYIRKDEELVAALSKDMLHWSVKGETSSMRQAGVFVSEYLHEDKHVYYWGEQSLNIAYTKDFEEWDISPESLVTPRGGFFDHSNLSVLGVSVIDQGILVLYDASYKTDGYQALQIGAALFSSDEPSRLLWRSEAPLWEQFIAKREHIFTPIGTIFFDEEIFLYFASEQQEIFTVSIQKPFISEEVLRRITPQLKKFSKNPIITANPKNRWEAEATFNPAALDLGGRVHLLYRAMGKDGISSFGYASSKDGLNFEDRLKGPAYFPREQFEGVYSKPSCYTHLYDSGGGWGGCEDPKLSFIDDKVYLTYVAFRDWNSVRAAISSISKEDFLNKNWNWETPRLISPPGLINKSCCILSEKVNGKYVVFHRIFPDILIDYVDSLDNLGRGQWLMGRYRIPPRPTFWDSRKVSVGAPPIKTKDGWLVISHGVDDRDPFRYKAGAMLLDLEDPTKVLFRSKNPILVPDQHYENDGHKYGIVYPGGAVVRNGELLVYYGGSDSFVCVACTPLDQLLYELKKDKDTTLELKKVSLEK